MKKVEILKSIDFEIKQRLDVLNTNNISREKKDWENAIKENKDPFTDAYDFLISIPLDHKGVTQEQYFAHCLRVSTLAMHFSEVESEKVGIIGLIHNIYEVSNVKQEEVIERFGTEISEGLSILKVERKLQSDSNYLREYYDKISTISPYLMNVKVLDKLDNLFVLGLNPNDDVRAGYLKEIKEYILPMSLKINKDLSNYLEKLIVYNEKTGFFTKEIKL